MEWLWIIVALLAGMIIGYWLARRACENEVEQAAATARMETVVATDEPTPQAGPVPVEPDDLRRIEGIGPKIAELIQDGGILTFAQMADAPVERLQGILDAAGERYRVHNPATWPMQARLAAKGKWDELQKLQDRLDGGKLV